MQEDLEAPDEREMVKLPRQVCRVSSLLESMNNTTIGASL